MQEKSQVNAGWLRKAAICLAFIGFLGAQDVRAWGPPPLVTVPPVGVSVLSGDTITLTATVGLSVTPLTIRWYLNGNEIKTNISNATVPLVNTTLSTLTLPNASSALAGNYSVKVENGGGEVTAGPAIVLVAGVLDPVVGIFGSKCGFTNGGFQLQLFKPAQSNCVVDASSDFIHWTPIYTNTSGSTNFSCLDSVATNLPSRYYRARFQ
jgi:hypothetical protein